MEQTIKSAKNENVRLARSLAQKKFRSQTGLFLVEGVNLIKDMPASVEVKSVFVTKKREDEVRTWLQKRAIDAAKTSETDEAQVFLVTDEVMQSLSDTVSPYGIAAVCRIPNRRPEAPKGKALLLDGVSDPGNLGTILRTAAACGFCDVYLLDCADVYAPKTARASLGAIFRLRIYDVDEAFALSLLRSTPSAALDMGGRNIFEAQLDKNVLLVAGSEAHGIRDSVADAAKQIVSLPMKGGIESLNVAVATAVAMYQFI